MEDNSGSAVDVEGAEHLFPPFTVDPEWNTVTNIVGEFGQNHSQSVLFSHNVVDVECELLNQLESVRVRVFQQVLVQR